MNIIYKKTKTGATQQWQQEIQGDKYRTISGQVGGKLITSEWTVCVGTNIGRANERSPEEQAIFEVAANYKKKLDKDYHTEESNISEGSKILPCMLAQDFKKALLRKNPPNLVNCYSQPKLDGMRCLVNRHGMWTRNGKPIVSCPHIFNSTLPLFDTHPDLVLDGELYNHEFKYDFNEIMSIVKQSKPTEDDIQKSAELAQYHIYDSQLNGTDLFSTRSKMVEQLVARISVPYIVSVRTDKVTSKKHLDELYYDDYLSDGYEGQIVRENAVYEGCRTWSLLKRKEFFDAEYILVDIESGKGNWTGKAKRATLRDDAGREFSAGILGTMQFTEKLLRDKHLYIGKKTVVNYTNLTPAGVPRHGRVKEWNRIDV